MSDAGLSPTGSLGCSRERREGGGGSLYVSVHCLWVTSGTSL